MATGVEVVGTPVSTDNATAVLPGHSVSSIVYSSTMLNPGDLDATFFGKRGLQVRI